MRVNIYTDGACSGNPGKGGYGIIMEWVGKPYVKEFSEGFRLTTNNRMELLAVIVALGSNLHGSKVIMTIPKMRDVTNWLLQPQRKMIYR